jgi:hypothetical protein
MIAHLAVEQVQAGLTGDVAEIGPSWKIIHIAREFNGFRRDGTRC